MLWSTIEHSANSFHSLHCLLSIFFDDCMSKLFPIFYLANFVCFYPSKYRAFPPNINYIVYDGYSRRKRGGVGVQVACIPFFVQVAYT